MEGINDILAQNLAVIFIALAVVAVVALLIAAVNTSRIRSITGRFAWVTGAGAGSADTLDALLKALQSSQQDITSIQSTLADVIEQGKTHLRRVGLVRYDAFEGIAGKQSYSLCLLDDNHNGVLLSSLVGHGFSRSYAVQIVKGQAARKLGDEESHALRVALGEQRPIPVDDTEGAPAEPAVPG